MKKARSVRVYQNGIPVWSVGIKNTRTGEKMTLEVTGATNEDATRKCNLLFGYKGNYQWTGTGPLYVPNPVNLPYYYEEEEG